MTRYSALAASVIVAFALAVPSAVEAQAQRRGGSDSGSSGSSSGGSRGGDSGGGSVAVPRSAPAPAPRAPVVRERPSDPSPSAVRGGSAARPSGSRPVAGSDTRGLSGSRNAVEASSAGARVRGAQAVRGVAQPRANAPTPPPTWERWDRWNRWSPWYSYGLGYSYGYYPYSYGYVGYNPWSYGYRWHDPFLFDPFAYGYGVPYYWGSSSSSRNDDRDQQEPTGSIRLRVNPDQARVYIDGALAGTAGEFGGLSNHLVLPAGVHELELRADGYQTYTGQIDVRDGRTRTERVNLKRQQ